MEIIKKHIPLNRKNNGASNSSSVKGPNPIEHLIYSLVEWSSSVFEAAPDYPALLTLTVEDVDDDSTLLVNDSLIENDEQLGKFCSLYTAFLISDWEVEEYSLNIHDEVCEIVLEDQVTIRYECRRLMN